MEAIFMDTENGKTNESNRFLYGLTDNLNLSYPNKNIALSNSSIYYTWKNINLHIITINLKFLLQLGVMKLIYLMDQILYQTFQIILNTLLKNMKLYHVIHLCKYM